MFSHLKDLITISYFGLPIHSICLCLCLLQINDKNIIPLKWSMNRALHLVIPFPFVFWAIISTLVYDGNIFVHSFIKK